MTHVMTKTLTIVSASVISIALAFTLLLSGSANTVGAASLVAPEDLSAGDLIRGESFSAVYYYGEDGFRYVFPNDKTYFTWYDNFDNVKWLSDSDMSSVQIGGNVTYKPGVRMIKINSDNKVYVVGKGGYIQAIPSEEVAEELYGSNWNQQIDDVSDGFFSNYTMGSALEFASQYDAAAEEASAWSISSDKSLESYTEVYLNESGVDSVTIDAGTAIRFINNGTDKHGASADDKSWGSGTLNAGDHFSRYFDEEGEHDYHDKYEDAHTGTITVE